MNKIKILAAIVILFVFGLLCQAHYQTVNKLKTEIVEKERIIEKLNNDNNIAKENCKEIIIGYALTIHDITVILDNLDEYIITPDKLVLDYSVAFSRTERFMDEKNKLLEEMNIDVEKLREEIDKLVERKGLEKR